MLRVLSGVAGGRKRRRRGREWGRDGSNEVAKGCMRSGGGKRVVQGCCIASRVIRFGEEREIVGDGDVLSCKDVLLHRAQEMLQLLSILLQF